MSYTNETTHYSIPLPLGTDKTTPMDYNTSMEAIDTAVFGAVGDSAQAVSDAADAKSAAQTATSDVAELTAALAETNATVATQGTTIQNLSNKVDDVDSDLSDAICSVVEATATAAYQHRVGEYFWYNDTLYRATQAIAAGTTIVPNTNCVTVTVADEITEKSVSVTSDGVKTYGQVLNELAALVDFSKVSHGSVLKATDSAKTTIAAVERITSSSATFTRVANIESAIATVSGITLAVGASTNVNAGIGATTYSFNDVTDTTCPANTVFKLIY